MDFYQKKLNEYKKSRPFNNLLTDGRETAYEKARTHFENKVENERKFYVSQYNQARFSQTDAYYSSENDLTNYYALRVYESIKKSQHINNLSSHEYFFELDSQESADLWNYYSKNFEKRHCAMAKREKLDQNKGVFGKIKNLFGDPAEDKETLDEKIEILTERLNLANNSIKSWENNMGAERLEYLVGRTMEGKFEFDAEGFDKLAFENFKNQSINTQPQNVQ